jgi:hypothetical protein
MAEEMTADKGWQRGDILGAFLQQQEIGMMTADKPGDVVHTGADPAQEIPADHAQTVFGDGGEKA